MPKAAIWKNTGHPGELCTVKSVPGASSPRGKQHAQPGLPLGFGNMSAFAAFADDMDALEGTARILTLSTCTDRSNKEIQIALQQCRLPGEQLVPPSL
jgi:hypothetical protein